MHRSSTHLGLLFISLFGCDRPVSTPERLEFIPQKEPAPVGFSMESVLGENPDDGFGSAIAVSNDGVWVGAPHGGKGRAYRWKEQRLELMFEGVGRTGSHIANTSDGIWVSAPLMESGEGAIFDAQGELRFSGSDGTGIVVSQAGSGTYAHSGGWRSLDGRTGSTEGRPTAIAEANGVIGIGFAFGSIAFTADSAEISRGVLGDEAGFSLAAGDIDGDGTQEWIIGSPGSNTVTAHNSSDLSAVAQWVGSGRFGTSIAVCDLDGNGRDDLFIGSPFYGPTGNVTRYADFSESPTPWEFDWPEATLQIGAALSCGNGSLYVGAPGDHDTLGRAIAIHRSP